MKHKKLVTFIVYFIIAALFFVGGAALEFCNPDASFILYVIFNFAKILGGIGIIDCLSVLAEKETRESILFDSVAEDNVEIEDDVFPDE